MRDLLTRFPLMEAEDLDRAEGWFDRHDRSSVLIGRLVPGVRSLISLPAGVRGMSLGMFVVLTTLGSAVWNTLLVLGGYLLGRQWRTVGRCSDWLNWAVVVLLVLGVAKFVWDRRDRIATSRGLPAPRPAGG